MRIEQLHYFLDVAQTQSITRSANNLFISPQGLSQAITALEKEHGMAFFERTKNGLILNDKGAAFRKLAAELSEHFQDFESEVAKLAGSEAGENKEQFSLLLPPLVILGDALGPMMDGLEQAFPSLDFSISEKNLEQVLGECRKMIEKEACVALVSVPDFRMPELLALNDVVVDVFLEMPIVAKVHRDSPLAQKKYLTKQELSTLPMACFNEPVMESVVAYMMRDFGEPRIVMQGSTSRLLRLRKDAVILSVDAMTSADDNVVIPIMDSISLHIAALYPQSSEEKSGMIANAIEQMLASRYSSLKTEA